MPAEPKADFARATLLLIFHALLLDPGQGRGLPLRSVLQPGPRHPATQAQSQREEAPRPAGIPPDRRQGGQAASQAPRHPGGGDKTTWRQKSKVCFTSFKTSQKSQDLKQTLQNPPTWSKVCFRSCDSTTPLQTFFLKVDVWTRIHSQAPRRPGHPGCQSQREETPARRQQAEAPSDQCRDEGFLKVAMGKVCFTCCRLFPPPVMC